MKKLLKYLTEQAESEDRGMAFLLILLTLVLTVWVFREGEYDCDRFLIWHVLLAVGFGLFFGRCREKRNWLYLLSGAVLLFTWSSRLTRLNPPLRPAWKLFDLLQAGIVSWTEYYMSPISHFTHFPQRRIELAVIAMVLGVYLLMWTARFCAKSKRGALLRFGLFLTLPVILLPLSLVLIWPFLSERSWQYGIFLPGALLAAAGISLALIAAVLVLAILKRHLNWKRLLGAYGILILISASVWVIFFGIQSVRRGSLLNRLAAEGRPMTLDEFYARRKDARDGTEKVSELFDLMKNPEFDTRDFPFNSSLCWTMQNVPGKGLIQPRKDEMIRVSEGPLGEKFTAGIAELAKYDQIRIGEYYTDFSGFRNVFVKLRALVRTGAGRAAIAHYTGKPGLILPRLKALTPVGRLLRYQPWPACAFDHANLDLILGSQVVALGPDGMQYADDYRFFLNWIRSQDYQPVRGGTEVGAELLKKCGRDDSSSRLNPVIFLLVRPMLIESVLRYCGQSLRREKYFAEHRDLSADDPIRPGFLQITASKGCLETAFALKLYRSIHGKYPDSTAALVPEILSALPLDPVTGKMFRYVLKKDHFELFSDAFDRKTPLLISEPRY
jgi:hypothetical protein